MLVMIELKGGVKVTGPESENLTPSGSKVAALLALVAVSDGTACTKEWVRSKLWSDRSPDQAKDSLRQAIASLKKCLGKYDDILIVKRNELAVDRSKTLIDVYDKFPKCHSEEQNQFLAGLKVKDKMFCEWMSITREKFAHKDGNNVTTNAEKQPSCITIGISPIVSHGEDSIIVGQMLITELTSALRELGSFTIYDFSGGPRIEVATILPDAMLVEHISAANGEYLVSLKLIRVCDRKVLWNSMCGIESRWRAVDKIPMISVYYTDQIANALTSSILLNVTERHSRSVTFHQSSLRPAPA